MLNLLSYIGLTLQSELCLWTLLGLIRTIFDATLFKVNANLKQVWQMSMPEQLSMPIQRGLRTIISGVMLVQCFTVYVYLASYIVLLYPVFLEERPNLVLPWLLLAAIRKLLCELTSLALGLGVCVLLGPARPPCIRFVVFKVASITPAFYMWMLVYSYYSHLKMAAKLQVLPAKMKPSDHDYGLELAVRRRRTKSLQGEDQLRKKIVGHLSGEGFSSSSALQPLSTAEAAKRESILMVSSTHDIVEDMKPEPEQSILQPLSLEPVISNLGAFEDIYGSEIIVPRDADRILEQFTVMMLRIAACIKGKGADPINIEQVTNNKNFTCTTTLYGDDADSLNPANINGKTASYVQNYPQIFMKKPSSLQNFANESLLRLSVDFENINEGLTRSNSPSQDTIRSNNYSNKLTTEPISLTKSNIKRGQPKTTNTSKNGQTLKIESTASKTIEKTESNNDNAPGKSETDPMMSVLNRMKRREENFRQIYQNEHEDIRGFLRDVSKSDSDIIVQNQKRAIGQYITNVTRGAHNSLETSNHQTQVSPSKSNDLKIESADSIEFTLKEKKLSESSQLGENEEEKPTSSKHLK